MGIDQQTGKLIPHLYITGGQAAGFTAGLDLKGNSMENVSRILSANGTWSIDENGYLVVKKVTAEEIETGKLKVEAQEQPEGITINDQNTKQTRMCKIERRRIKSYPRIM